MLSDFPYGHAPLDGRYDSLREGRVDDRFAARTDARALFVCRHCSGAELDGESVEAPAYYSRTAT